MIKNPEYDNQITDILKNSGYLEIWKMDYEKNPWKYDGTIFITFNNEKQLMSFRNNNDDQSLNYDNLRIAMALSELALFSSRTISVNEGLRYQHQYNLYSQLFTKHNLDYFYTQIKLYEQLLINCRKRINAANYVLKHYSVIE